MMTWAETAAREEEISRDACDQWSLASHQKACTAQAEGKFDAEIISVEIAQRKGAPVIVDRDENPRSDSTIERLGRLKPVLGGVCTAGNSSTENDGAAAVVVTSRQKAAELGIEVLAHLKSCAVVGDDPRHTYRTVPTVVKKALAAAQVTIDQMDLIEVQEAFAAQVLADLKQMGVDSHAFDKVNVNGSGISLGHPIAATGTRVMVTLLHEMKRRQAKFGLETICGGGGLGIAAVFERSE
jgi:acetyl-CoA C-acetyltransferase